MTVPVAVPRALLLCLAALVLCCQWSFCSAWAEEEGVSSSELPWAIRHISDRLFPPRKIGIPQGKPIWTLVPGITTDVHVLDAQWWNSSVGGAQDDFRRKKKDCQLPSTALREVMGSEFKRALMAEDEVELRKRLMEEQRQLQHRLRGRGHLLFKREGEEVMPWTCRMHYKWLDLGFSFSPRFIRTGDCSSSRCLKGKSQCRPRHYVVKVLRRQSPDEVSTCEDQDVVSLPESLRQEWKFHKVNVTLCCDCVI